VIGNLMMGNRDLNQSRAYHDSTRHSYWSIRSTPHYLDWPNRPLPFKIYTDLEPIPLPKELMRTGVPAIEAIARPAATPKSAHRPTLDQLTSILYYSAGVTKMKQYPGGTIYFRAAACAGALYPTEIYVVCSDVEGLAAGVYHFNAGDFALRRLREGDFRGALVRATASEPHVASAPVTLVFSAISWRSSWKYRDRSYRYHFWDSGMIVANALAMAASHDLPAQLVMGFVEAEINKLIGIDGMRELALGMLTLGHDESSLRSIDAAEGPHELDSLDDLYNLDNLYNKVVPLSYSQVDYDSIFKMHEASSLTSPDEVRQWRESAVGGGAHTNGTAEGGARIVPLVPLPDDLLPREAIEEVIQRRASTRRFAHRPIRFAELSVMLERAARAVPSDFLSSDEAHVNDIYMIVNRVEGLEPGAYFYGWERRELELLKGGEFAERARYLTLEQDLGGDAAVTIFFMADLDHVLERLGNRGYRAAQMEAGVIGGRLYLAAYALGRGATGLTFYDDDVTEFFSPHAAGRSCIFVTAIGAPGRVPMF
jgi:SagB-type dehydrogenase family enzyme